jgi:hypothetical protein
MNNLKNTVILALSIVIGALLISFAIISSQTGRYQATKIQERQVIVLDTKTGAEYIYTFGQGWGRKKPY